MSKVLVAGSINMDIVVFADRHPSVGETVVGKDLGYFPGGKGANQAVAAAKMGADVVMLGAVGDDASAGQLLEFLASVGVDQGDVLRVEGPTGTALIVVAGGDNEIVVVPGANGYVAPEHLTGISVETEDVLISQFEIPIPAIEAFFATGRAAGARTILNPAPAASIPARLAELVDLLVLNESELQFLTGGDRRDASDHSGLADDARKLINRQGQSVVVTLGASGALLVEDAGIVHLPGHSVEVVDTTGAGDCFVGVLGASLASGSDLQDALERANLAASICVQRPGAGPSMPDAVELEKTFSG